MSSPPAPSDPAEGPEAPDPGSNPEAARTFSRGLLELAARQESVPSPEELAQLARCTFSNSEHSAALLNGLHKILLKATVERARRECAFYRQPHYAEWAETEPEAPPDLSPWPILTREQVRERFYDFIAGDVRLSGVCHTSGTTGKALDIFKSGAEVEAQQRYFREFFRPTAEAIDLRPLTLSFPNFYHGVAVPLPGIGMTFVSGVTDDTLIDDALRVLKTAYKIPGHEERISSLTGLAHHVELFTSYLIEQGLDPASFGLRSVTVVGGFVSRLVRQFLADSWKTVVIDRFSLTEMTGGASRCLHCDMFHFDPLPLVEVVDVDSGRALEEGPGRLVLTDLYPFAQMQPLLRYYTGDLVRRVRSSCTVTPTFEFLGKEKNCIRHPEDGAWVLFSGHLFELVNEIPDIAVYDWFANVRRAQDRTIGGRQLYQLHWKMLDSGVLAIEVVIEMRYAPHLFADRSRELRRQITEGLRAANPTFAERVGNGSVRFEIHLVGPGSLANEAFAIKV